MRNTAKQSAFTLVELLIVIVILGITASIMLPLLSSNSSLQLQAAVRELDSMVKYTQNLAITRQGNFQIIFDTQNNTLSVCDADGNLIDDPGKTAPSSTTDPDKYRLKRIYGQGDYSRVVLGSALFDGTNTLWFDRLGMPYSGEIDDNTPLTSGEIIFNAAANTMKLKIEPVSGKVTIE